MGRKFQLCGASTIVYKNDRVLLQQRKDNGCWGYHGGAIELGERVEDAAKRELFEETGLSAHNLDFFGVFSGPEQYHVYPDGNEAYIIDIVFLCNDFSGVLKKQGSELISLQWFDISNIPTNLSPPIRTPLQKFCMEHQ